MANTYQLIASNTVGAGGAATIDFTSIPQTYTDLKLVFSLRASANTINISYRVNGNTGSVYSSVYMNGTGAAAASGTNSGTYMTTYGIDSSTYTANIFASGELYFVNYTSSTNKCIGLDSANENNATTAYIGLSGDLFSSTAAITSISLSAYPYGGSTNLVQYSSAYLYGIKNA